MSKENRILFISPTSTKPGLISGIMRIRPKSLEILADLTPRSKYECVVVDENMERFDFSSECTKGIALVGISSMTAQAPRAYWIAEGFRRRGIPVVLGGMHPTASPEEAIAHADSIVIGEAERLWPKLLEDFEKGELKKFYRNREWIDLSNLPMPRGDLVDKYEWWFRNTTFTSRGCPFDCSFCSVSKFFGKRYRFRPIEDVIAEIKNMLEESKNRRVDWWRIDRILWKKIVSDRTILFLDDNIFGNSQYARRLFEALIPLRKSLRISWGAQASIDIAKPENEELLELACKSGCKALFIGIESIDPSSLKEIGKCVNKPERYAEEMKRLHKHRITVVGAFVFGFDSEDKSIFERTLDFAKRIKVDITQAAVLTPLPGTRLMEKLEREGRIIEKDWSKYTFGNVVFKPKNMSPEELEQGTNWVRSKFYSFGSMWRRRPPLSDWLRCIIYCVANIGYRIQILKISKYKRKIFKHRRENYLSSI